MPRPRLFASERVREVLQRYPALKGVFVEWEPNVLDGLDSEYVGQPFGDADNGTAGSYWVREADGKENEIWGSSGMDAEEPYYVEPKTTGKPALIDPYVDEDIGVLMSTIAVPVVQRGRFVGVVGMDFPLAGLGEQARSVRPFETGYMTIYANSGMVLAGPDGLEVGKPDPALPADMKEAIASGQAGQYRDGEWLHLVRPVIIEGLEKPWAIRISASADVVYAASRAATLRAIVISALIGLATLGVLAWFVLRTMAPLGRLSNTFAELASGQGDLTQRLNMGEGQDEISTLARSFDRFTQTLRKMLIDVRECAGKLNGTALEVDRETDEIGQHCAQQAESAVSTASSVHQLFTSISRVAESSGQASEITRTASGAAEKVAKDVHDAAREVSQVEEAISRVDSVLGNLRQRSEEIGNVVQVIRDIA
ncbi:MAG: methyl-accepting chemotaxis protein, partial [Bacteroidales bacterium]|nr:methyl-accepting chemotaxis protein [Bacteroidales bacterium]